MPHRVLPLTPTPDAHYVIELPGDGRLVEVRYYHSARNVRDVDGMHRYDTDSGSTIIVGDPVQLNVRPNGPVLYVVSPSE